MCILEIAGAAGAAAAGGSTLSTIATMASVAGTLAQGIAGYQAGNAQAAMIERQAEISAELNAVKAERVSQQMTSQMRLQAAELVARGVQLDSPTAIALGMNAGRELSFATQSVRATGQAEQIELSNQALAARAHGMNSLLRGGSSAAAEFLTGAPEIWPGLLS